ncbi:MAG: tetratricopeptide repeat protein [Acidobacteriota bacterium]
MPEVAVMIMARLFLIVLIASSFLPGQSRQDAKALSDEAHQALASGHYPQAIGLYQKLIKLYPNVPGLKMNLGMAYYLSGDYQKAVAPLAAAAGSGQPDLIPASMFLGSSYVLTGQPAKAVRVLERYLKHKPDDSRAREALGDAFRDLGRRREAAKQYRKLVELDASSTKGWYELGKAYEALAGQAFDTLEQRAPDSAYVLALIADARVVRQQYRSAFYFYRKALQANPRMRGIHVALSRVYRATGHEDWAAVEEQKETALGLPDCQKEKIVCDFLEGRMLEVAQAAKKMATPEGLYWVSQVYNQLAVQAFERLSAFPDSLEWRQLRAEVHENQGDYLEAAKEWRKVLEAAPRHPLARRGLALSLFLAKDHQAAKAVIDELLRQEPQSSQWNYLKGEIFLAQEKADEALPFLLKAVRKEPDFLPAHASLGRTYLALGQPAKAIPHLERALPSDSDGNLHYQLARACQTMGDTTGARAALQKYQEIQRKNRQENARLEQEAEIRAPE